MVANEVQEELVDPEVVAGLGMEGGCEEIALADEDRIGVAGGEGFDLGAGAGDAGGADEDHLERAALEFGGGGEDGGVDLATVGVALDGDVEGGEGSLGGAFDVFGEEDRSGAGAEGRGGADEGLEGVEEVVALEELEHGGGFAAGHDEAVDFWWAGEVFRGADEFGGGSEGLQGLDVRGVCALEGEDAYGEGV